jgi:RHS repeat-associated protein
MTQLKPVDQKPSTWQCTTLLATDNSHSIIGEIVDGKHNSIAYTAYGEQSALQEDRAGLGFNGQLREAKIGWYLLGNGYRAYNPRLMRFHSPDSWSPFDGGGLNSYMYCVGDPVNRFDPTGHLNLLRVFGFNQHKSWNAYNVPNVPDTALDIEIGMRPANLDEFGSLMGAGAVMAARAPGPGGLSSTPIGNSPAIGIPGSAGIRNYPVFEGAAAITTTAIVSSPSPVAARRFSAGANTFTSNNFDAPRTLWNGPAPQSPKRERMILLGGSSGTERSHPRDRGSATSSTPTMTVYRNAGDRLPGNGWVTDTSSNGYQNIQVFVQRQRDPVMINPNDPGPSSRAVRNS